MPIKYLLFSLLAVLIWVGNTIVSKLAAGTIAPGTIAFERWFIAFVILTPLVGRDAWRQSRTIASHLPKLILLGLLGMAACQGLGYYAAGFTTATNMAIMLSLVPLLTLILGAVFFHERPSSLAVIGGVVSLSGIFVVLSHGDPSRLLSEGVGRGDAMMLVAVLAYAAYGILLRRWAIPLATWTSIYVQIGAAVVLLVPSYLLSAPSGLNLSNTAMVLYAAIPGSILAPFVWMSAVKHLGAARTAIFMNLIPILTAIVAAIFLGETLYVYHLIGGGMTVAGIILVQRKSVRERSDQRTVATRAQ
ncbi:multidrug DMT transporter [Rhizobium sp. NBRC 114257]|uniref:Multidrug DMT transporter n=1 Tax=Rhizobium dioscoreae TaxID=2653122 RepID=A0ABQ0ZDR6_9HYPH|nr:MULTISPECIES: DMT family transporter [Rhizobium]GES53532.1 multidrug DMT transporter [Rhizobium dioscoreae]GLU85000.1 multidrug DMT transporter [Rhizobium sp. NBRC 114257]